MNQGTMGNIVQCCHTLSNYFKCKDALGQGGPERSPLLSSDESECDSPSLQDDLEDNLLTVSTSVTNPTLEPENFLYPDIILSSNLGGDVTLVEPMVCLLVSEEEEEVRLDERGDGQERSNRGRNRGFSEVETQTEVETQIAMGVQTQTESQTEVQAQMEILVCHNETVVRQENTQTDTGATDKMVVGVWEQHGILKQVGVPSEAPTSQEGHSEAVIEMASEKQPKATDSGNWSDINSFVDLEVPEKTERQRERNKLTKDIHKDTEQKEMKEEHIHEGLTSSFTKHVFETKRNTEVIEEINMDEENVFELHHTLPTQENAEGRERKFESGCTSVILSEHILHNMDENIAPGKSQKNMEPTKYNIINTDIVEECGVHLTRQSDEASEQTGQLTVGTDLNMKEKAINTTSSIHLPEEHTESSDHIQENMKREEDDNKTGLQRVVEPQVEEEEGGAEIMLFSVDRLFLAAPHVKALPSPTEESPEDDRPEQSDTDKRKQLTIRDIVDLQETGFTVRIQSPGAESFELQVSGQLLVAELHQVLMEHEITCHRTCFSLQLGGTVLDSLTELCSIEGIQDGALIKVVEDSYSVRDARLHLRHVRDLLRSLDPTDAYNGVNRSSLSYLMFYTRGDKNSESVGSRRASEKESVNFRPPEYILPGCKDRPLSPLQPVRDDWKPLQCLRVLTMSSWNPPPGNRKMHGDLMYLNVLTMEDKELNITSSTRGFYLNQSTAFNFNPKPAIPKILCHSLVELLSQVSPAFRKTFSALQKKRVQQHPYERIATPFQLFTWIAHQEDHTLDCVRAEETHTSRMGQDEHTAGQNRDWNEELQGCRELTRNSLQERLHRERSIFRTNSDFVEAAARGAVAVVDGNVMPLNPAEAPHMQMFIWNNLFFSLGFDISEHYHPLGGNTAAHAAAICDLRGAQAYTSVDIEGLHTLGTAVVDYRGVRVIAQTIVPGILEKNQEQSVVYGSNDYGQTVFTHPRFLELLDKTSKPLRIQRHQVLDHRNNPVELCSGIETKGILGNDGRPYILDLLRTFPPDLNHQFIETAESSEVPKECQSFGYPRRHHHSLASLRPELIEAFVQHKYELYVKMVSQGLIQLEEQEKSTVSELRTGDTATDGADMGE
ncbi:Clustered mitochondria protein-like protein [Nibea albiflora]|uniref:Clustered mitochondria protein-like protein n=1 Tax=Nibea albiflora TaxID=240163 RepID=A0ACB7F138_NIBAL|nr:Clustered mitochondria protein-like protein [Nibea albiflora]